MSGQYVEQQTTDWYMPMIGESAFLGPPQGLGPWSVLLGRGANPIYLDLFKVIFLLCTMVNHHETTIWLIFLFFPNHLKQI